MLLHILFGTVLLGLLALIAWGAYELISPYTDSEHMRGGVMRGRQHKVRPIKRGQQTFMRRGGRWLPHRETPYIRNTYYGVSTYSDYQEDPLHIRFHFDETHPAYELWQPIWKRLKEELGTSAMNISFSENNENINTTPGLKRLPIIIKRRSGVSREYNGPREYVHLYNWVMAAI